MPKKIIIGILSGAMILSLCSCNPSKPVETPTPTPEPTPIPIQTPVVTETPAPELKDEPEKKVQELNFSMEDNPPEAMPKVEAANQLLDILDESLTKSLSQNKYSLKFSEVVDSNSLYGNINFNYRALDLTKDSDIIYFDALNGGKFYKGQANQTPGNPISNLSAKNLITSRDIDAMKDLGFENGINDIYSLFINVINTGGEDFEKIYKEHPESIDISYKDLENDMTQYDLTLINAGNIVKTNKNMSASSYIDKTSKIYLESSQTKLTFIVDNNKLIQSISINDTLSAGFYNQTSLTRYITINYNPTPVDSNVITGEGEIPVIIGSMARELNMGRIVKYNNPNSAETTGGIDDSKWEITYKKQNDGSYKAVQLHAGPTSAYTINGITAGVDVSTLKSHLNCVISQDNDIVIGLVKSGENVFTVISYLKDGVVSYIDVKLNPISSLFDRALYVGAVGSYAAKIIPVESMRYFNSTKESIPNFVYKTLTKSFSMKQTVEISGQNLAKYNGKVMGIEIHPELNYIYSSITGDRNVSEANEITRIGSFISPATVLNVFAKNVPSISLSGLNKTENEDGTITYTGSVSPDDVGFEQLVRLACDYPKNDITNIIEDVKGVDGPTNMYVDIVLKENLLQTLQIKLESKRDSVLYKMEMEYR